MVGAGVLGLPYAFSYLGFFGGSIMLTLAGGSALYTAWLLASMHEMNGVRHNRYLSTSVPLQRVVSEIAGMLILPYKFVVHLDTPSASTSSTQTNVRNRPAQTSYRQLHIPRLVTVILPSDFHICHRYRDLGTAILGKKYSNLFIAPFQFSVMVCPDCVLTVLHTEHSLPQSRMCLCLQ